ncbi:MAG: PH domain-containing protein [Actinobacteria bacterium]|nr:PH domain-containing protein [Actinomycetota bacterium]
MSTTDHTGAFPFDKQDQVDKIEAGLLSGESIIAVYDGKGGGTGFIGLTNRRLVLQDNGFVGKRVALTSVPYRKINAVSFISDKSMLGRIASSSSIAVSVGSATYEIEFRGQEKAKHAHDVMLGFMS